MRIRVHRYKDKDFGNQWFDEVQDRWEYEDFIRNRDWRENWISFDCACYEGGLIYLGISSFDADIFRAFDPATGRFIDLGYRAVADRYDAKFHRSLVKREKDGCLYGAIALFHDIDRYWDAPGGAVIRYDPANEKFTRMATPLAHVYIQMICLDNARDMLYGVTFTPERLFRLDLTSGCAEDLGPVSSGFEFTQGQNIVVDDAGCVWTAWTVTRAWQDTPGADSRRLCKFDPALGRMVYYRNGLPRANGSAGYAKLDGLFNFGDGTLIATGGNGSLYRIDPASGAATLLGTPIPDRPSRLSAMALGPDGAAYGVTGGRGRCEVIRFDPRSEKYALLGSVVAEGVQCWQVHDVVMTPEGVLYACENDNPYRSSYLWEIQL
jgi:sugar lactone lactonase YvrE